MLSQELLVSLRSILDPDLSNERRLEYFRITEQYKTNQFELGDLAVLCAHDQYPTLILFGLQCLEYKIKHSWNETPVELKLTIKESLFQLTSNFHKFTCFLTNGRVITLILSQIFVHLIKCEWPQQWPSMLQEFMELQTIGAAQSKLMMNTLLRLYEDVVQFQGVPQSRRRDIMMGLNDSLGTIVNFTFRLIMQQLCVLESPKPCYQEAICLCKDSLSMLVGFFDSCRMDVLYQWSPDSMSAATDVSGLPCAQLFTRLMRHPDLQSDTLNFLLLLMNRKNHHSGSAYETSTSFINKFMQECQTSNAFCLLLRSLVSQTPVFSDQLYTVLRLLSEVFVKMGHHIVSQWSNLETITQFCTCDDYSCGNVANHILDGLVLLTTYRIHVVSALTLGFWMVALRSPSPSLSARFCPLLPSLFAAWQFGLIKDNSDLNNQWTRGVYEEEEYPAFYCRSRGNILKCLSLAASAWPREFLQLLSVWKNSLLERASRATDLDASGDLLSEFSALELCMEHTLGNLKKFYLSSGQTNGTGGLGEFLDFLTRSAEQCLLGICPGLEAGIREKLIVCATLLVQHLDDDPVWIGSATVESVVLLLLKEVFAALSYSPNLSDGQPPLSEAGQIKPRPRSKSTLSLHLAVSTALFRLAQSQPSRLLPQFSVILGEASRLWPSQDVGVMEKCILLEAFITLCFRLQQPLQVQADLLRQLLVRVDEAWIGSTVEPQAQPTVMRRLLETCTSYGGVGLLRATGLDHPIDSQDKPAPGGTESYTDIRRILVHSVLWLLAAVRRLVDPVTEEQHQHLTLPSLEPLLTPTLVLVRAFNELSMPQVLAHAHPTVLPAFEISEYVKCYTLCLQINRTQQQSETNDLDEKTSLGHLRSFLHSCHDNLLTGFGLLLTGLGQRLYALPTDQLAVVIHQACCAAFEQLPDYKVANLIRFVIRPYLLHCPKQYLPTAVVPLVPQIIGAVVQRLDLRWQQLSALNSDETGQDEKAIAEEMVKERLTRLLSRSCLDMMRLLFTFNGFEKSSQTARQDDGPPEGEEDELDVEMAPEAKSGQPSVSSLGCLARQMAQVAMTATDLEADPLMLCSLVRCLGWPDSSSCLRAAQWITSLIDLILKVIEEARGQSAVHSSPVHLPIQLAEHLFQGVLVGLHVNGRSVDCNLHGLLSAAVHVYTSVDPEMARCRLNPLLRQALLATASSDAVGDTASETDTAIKNLENCLLSCGNKSTSVKTKRDIFKKVVQPLIGVPLSQRFRDQVCIASLAPVKRPGSWRHLNRNRSALQDDDFGLISLFSGD